MRNVARRGDVTATASTRGKFGEAATAATGLWTAQPLQSDLVPQARSDSASLVRSASCEFRFVGKLDSDPNTPVTGSVTLRLEPGSTVLRVDRDSLLCAGDHVDERFGNSILVTSEATWRTDVTEAG